MCDVIFMHEFTRLYMRYAVQKYLKIYGNQKLKTFAIPVWVNMFKKKTFLPKRRSCKNKNFRIVTDILIAK